MVICACSAANEAACSVSPSQNLKARVACAPPHTHHNRIACMQVQTHKSMDYAAEKNLCLDHRPPVLSWAKTLRAMLRRSLVLNSGMRERKGNRVQQQKALPVMLRSPLKLELQETHLTPVGAATWPALKRGSKKPVRLHCGMLPRLAVAPASHICTSHLLTAVGRSHTVLAEKFLLAVMVLRLLCRNLKQCGPLDRFLHMAGGCWIGLMSSRDIEPGSTACTPSPTLAFWHSQARSSQIHDCGLHCHLWAKVAMQAAHSGTGGAMTTLQALLCRSQAGPGCC